jgi:hypothetical protein
MRLYCNKYTQSEVQRCLLELIRVKVTRFTTNCGRRTKRTSHRFRNPNTPAPQPEPKKPKPKQINKRGRDVSGEMVAGHDHQGLNRLEVLKTFWEHEGEALGGVNATVPEWTGDKRASLLQIAAQSGQ